MMYDEYRYNEASVVGIVQSRASPKGEIEANARVMDDAYALGQKLLG
jgi:hypothetical protein